MRHKLAQRGGTIGRKEHCERVDIVGWIFEQVPFIASLVGSEVLLALVFLTLTTTLVAFGVPGVLMPISFSSGALLGGWFGMLVVISGAVLGSQLLFVATRHGLGERLRRRWGEQIARFDRNIEQRGFYYLLGLRLVGAPHVLVTASSALSAIRARSFVMATLFGLLPAIAIAAMAGSAV
jgi:uncharacterized membrane protein YdjX (TVP38/TMEM64 family)